MTAFRGGSRTSQTAGAPALALLRAAHAGPTVAVTTLVALLAIGAGTGLRTGLLLVGAVLTGQLTIGWVNDLVDARRDREVGRTDKPLANGEVAPGVVATALGVAGALTVVLSAALGWRSAAIHLLLVVGSGQAYNLGLKATAWSWLPYAVAFGMLPAVVTLAGPAGAWPDPWLLVAAGTLGVAAHVLNALPDLADDAATGVRGMPHRLGARRGRLLATALLVAASLAAVLARPGAPEPWAWAVLAAVLLLAGLTLVGDGRRPFQAAIGIALLDVVLVAAA